MRVVKVINHAVPSLCGAVGTVLSQCDVTQSAEVLFQFGESPDSQVIAHISECDLHRTNSKALTRWVPPPATATAPTNAPLVVSEAHNWDDAECDQTSGNEFDVLRLGDRRERDAQLNQKLRIFERGVTPIKALREREAEWKRLQMAEMIELEEIATRQELDRWQKQRLTRYRNKFAKLETDK